MIPLELITMLGSTVLGGVMKLFAQRQENEKLKHQMTMEAMQQIQQERTEIRQVRDTRFQWTRRVIALSVIFAVMILPKLAAFTDVSVVYGWTEMVSGFWPFTNDSQAVKWVSVEARSIMITPLDTHIVSAIIGLYFGNSIVGHK